MSTRRVAGQVLSCGLIDADSVSLVRRVRPPRSDTLLVREAGAP